MKIEILFQDDFLMVINKPSGVVVNRVETEKRETVQDWVEERLGLKDNKGQGLREELTNFVQRTGIVHRLDKETSGCLIIAKTPEAFTELQRQFKARKVKKEYLALVHGFVEPKEGTIRVPIARSHHDRDKFAVTVGGRISETEYKVVKHLIKVNQAQSQKLNQQLITNNQQRFTLLRVFPLTGRTHQIRVHFKYFGHPLVSDEKYGGSLASEDRKWCPRIFLHAAKIEFYHPVKKNKVSVETDLSPDLNEVSKNLKLSTYKA